MKSFAFTLLLFAGTITLAGCTIGSMPNVEINDAPTTEVQMAPIQGSVYGGHAPLVGAHIYLVQPGTAGYGSVVKGLLKSTYANSTFPTTQNGSWTNSTYASDQFVPSADASGNPFYGVTSDATGSYYLTGDYTCTVGQPVIAIGYGGAPTYPGTTPYTFPITGESVALGTYQGVSGGFFTYTVGGTTPMLYYVGESVTISGFTGLNAGYNVTDPVSSTASTTQFTLFVAGYNGGTGSGTATGSAVATPTFNPAAVNMAVLGNCPSSGNFSTAGNGAISYIYMNEVSTTAAAYAFAGFTNTSVTDQNGNDEFHIGSSGSTQGLQGLYNAAITAGLLYDIQGSSVTTTFAGEGHIARSTTPNGGYGTVPQATLDTIGNILAACVDSNNTYRQQSGTVSVACNTLESTAQDNGVVDGSTITTGTYTHVAFNIAQAAFNMARFPQGAGTGTTNTSGVTTISASSGTTAASYVSTLYGIPTGNVPYTPNLVSTSAGKPNDWSIPIVWSLGTGVSSSDVELDSLGNAFIVTGATGLYEITPAGVRSNPGTTALSTALSAGLAIDASNFVWAPGATGNYVYAPSVGVNGYDGSNTTLGSGIAVDNNSNQYVASGSDASLYPATATELVKQTATNGTAYTGSFPLVGSSTATANTVGACEYGVGFVALDSSANLWTATSDNTYDFGNTYVCRFSNTPNGSAATLKYSIQVPSSNSNEAGGFSFVRGMVTDNGDNLIFADKNLDALYVVAKGTTTTNSYTSLTIDATRLRAPSWLAVDGANTLWVSSTGDGGATTGDKYATGLVHYSDAAAALTPAYITGTTLTTTPATCLNSVAIDPSGNVWSATGTGQGTCTTANTINEYVGMAAPTRTPIAVAKTAAATGTKP